MKACLVLVSFLISSSSLHAQEWERIGEISEYEALNSSGSIQAITVDGNGSPYMMEYSNSPDHYNRISKWFGTRWNTIGTGTPEANGLTNSKGLLNSMVMESSGTAYIAGRIKDNNKYCVKKWDGLTWSVLGANSFNVNNTINVLALDGLGNLYAAGDFKDANGKLCVAKWDGTTWSYLASLNATTGGIKAMIADNNGNIFVTGSFKDSYQNYYVAQWNGTQWLELGLDNDNKVLIGNEEILTLAIDYNHTLYAGGQFFTAGKQYVAKWDGSVWSKVGDYGTLVTNGYVYSLVSDHSNNIYACGGFSDSGGARAVIKWDGSNWSQVGSPGNRVLFTTLFNLVVDNSDNLFVAVGKSSSTYNVVAKYKTNNTITGLDARNNANKLTVFPNPSKDVFSVQLSEEGMISIYNTSGRLIQQQQVVAGNHSINLTDLSIGIYTLVFNGQHNYYSPVKLVKE